MTRAKDELHLTYALSRGSYEGRRASLPSPFLRALGDEPTPTLYQILYGAVTPSSSKPSAPTQAVARTAKSSAPAPFLPGQRVRHPELGTGIVVKAAETVVTVMFPGGTGMRSFPLLNCPLEEA